MSVLLDEEKLLKLTEDKKALFILQWLEGLPQILSKVDKNELKKHHNQLIQQLVQYGMQGSLSPPLRNLLSACLVSLYSVGDMTTLFTTINGCMDIIKMKDDPQQLANKTTCVICLGALFKHHGRMAGSLFIEIVQVLLKASKINEVANRCTIIIVLSFLPLLFLGMLSL
jgi:sulfur relay (sulfurtransferase) DsrC/TusE family protein